MNRRENVSTCEVCDTLDRNARSGLPTVWQDGNMRFFRCEEHMNEEEAQEAGWRRY